MNERDKKEFSDLIDALASAFRQDATKAMKHGYWLGLMDLSLDSVRRGVGRAVMECEFMPSVAALRELGGVVSSKHRTVFAFQALEKAILVHGSGVSVNFDDKVLNAAVRNLGGWIKVCETPEEEFQTFFRHRFDGVYGSLFKSGINSEMAERLVGRYESANVGITVNGDGSPYTPPRVEIKTNVPGIENDRIKNVEGVRMLAGSMAKIERAWPQPERL